MNTPITFVALERFAMGWADMRGIYGTSVDYKPPRPPHVREELTYGLEWYWEHP